jgi:hypothetical protein
MKNIRYISAQPAIDYYTWQVEVMIHSFMRHGVNPNYIDIVCSIKDGIIPDNWLALAKNYNMVRFFFYNDTRKNPVYVSSIRPHILKKHFEKHPYLQDEAIFYHDCDIMFTNPPTWNHLKDDDVWYLSDCKHYIGADYIQGKKFGIYERMCEIVGIDESIPIKNEASSGGAQYFMKNIDATFWEKVETDSEKLYQFFLDHLKAFPEGCLKGYHPIQKWTADMWAVLWNGWYFKHETKIIPEMDFTWPLHGMDVWPKNVIYHNAGVTVNHRDINKMFFKCDYMNKLPYDIKQEDFTTEFCTYKYVEEIVATSKITCLL